VSRERDEDHGAGPPAAFGWVGICGRCREPMRPVSSPGVNGAAECPRCGLLVPGVVVRSRAIDLPPNLTQQQIRGILTTQALRLAECERRLAALERNVDD
jgi:hypothetical protein